LYGVLKKRRDKQNRCLGVGVLRSYNNETNMDNCFLRNKGISKNSF
jgi:hypothetical protein